MFDTKAGFVHVTNNDKYNYGLLELDNATLLYILLLTIYVKWEVELL